MKLQKSRVLLALAVLASGLVIVSGLSLALRSASVAGVPATQTTGALLATRTPGGGPVTVQATVPQTAPIFSHLRQVSTTLTLPEETSLIHAHDYVCGKCQHGTWLALYATNLAPEDVIAFYKNFIDHSAWSFAGSSTAQDVNGEITQWVLDGRGVYDQGSPKFESFKLLVNKSEATSEWWYAVPQALQRAKASGSSVYIIAVQYIENTTSVPGCGGGGLNSCEESEWKFDEEY